MIYCYQIKWILLLSCHLMIHVFTICNLTSSYLGYDFGDVWALVRSVVIRLPSGCVVLRLPSVVNDVYEAILFEVMSLPCLHCLFPHVFNDSVSRTIYYTVWPSMNFDLMMTCPWIALRNGGISVSELCYCKLVLS